MLGRLVVILVVTQLCSGFVSATTSKVVCYHGTWARYRSGNGAYGVKNIDTSKCTHIIYSFVSLSDDGTIKTLDSYLDYNLDNLNEFTSLKNNNKNLKTLVAIGGWNEGSVKFSNVAASASLRATFIQSALDFVLKHNFDGFDFDWEYPAQRGGAAADKQNFIILLREFRQVFKSHNLLVSAAVAAAESSVSLSYDVAALSDNLDMINIMAYDLHASWDGVTGHNAPLYASSIDVSSAAKQLNVDSIVTNWINRGAAPEKLILGIPLYGRSFTLSSSSNVRLGASSSGAGTAGPYTLEAGYLGYNEICEKLAEGGWTYVWDNEQQVPHIYKGDQWIGYDDPRAVQLKVKYAQDKKLGGVMVWAIETDDFKGISGVKHALLAAIQQQLGISSDSSSANAEVPILIPDDSSAGRQVVTTTTTVSSASNSQSSICTKQGYVRDSKDCQVFYYCDQNNVPNKFKCSDGLYYDPSTRNCNWAYNVQGC